MKKYVSLLILLATFTACKTPVETQTGTPSNTSGTVYTQPSQNKTSTPPEAMVAPDQPQSIAVRDELDRIASEKASLTCSLLEMKKESASGGTLDQERYNQIDERIKMMNEKISKSYTPEQIQKIEELFQKYMNDCAYKDFQ